MSQRFTGSFPTATVSISGTGAFTCCAWVYAGSTSTFGVDVVFVDNGSDNIEIALQSSGNWHFGQVVGGSTAYTYAQAATASVWTHLALVFDGTTSFSYVNGALVDSAATTVAGRSAMSAFDVGTASGDVTIQDIKIFASALSQSAVAREMRISKPGLSASAWWPLIIGIPTIDLSGNGHALSAGGDSNGTVFAPAVWSPSVTFQPLRAASGATSITASGVTNVTGAAAVTSAAALVAAGTTNVTGAAAITKAASAAASGTTQVTGAATITKSAAIVAAGTTQVTGAADLPNGLLTGYSAGSSFAGFTAWVYPRSNVAASDVVWCPLNQSSTPIGLLRISLNGTTLRFEATNDSTGSSRVFSQSLTLNAWTHVSAQIGSTTATFYVNGVAVDSGAFDKTNVSGYGQLIIGRNADATIRDAIVGSLGSTEVRMAYAMRAPQGYGGVFTYYPLLEGGQRLSNFGGFVSASLSPLTVLGSGLAEGSENPPAPWGGPNTLQYLTAGAVNIAITAAGVTQVSGSAAASSAAPIVAAGTTQVTGAAALTAAAPIVATGLTQVTGAAAVTASAPLVAAGLTQVTGAVSVNPTWPIVATGLTQVSGAAAISASAPLVAAGLTQVTGAANLTSPGDVASTGLTQVTGTAALTAAAPLVAAGTTQTTGSAALVSSAPLAAAGATNVTGVATVSSSASAASVGTTQVTGAADVSIAYSITAAGVTQVSGSAAFQGVAPPSSPGGDTFFSRRFLHTVGRRHVR